MFYTIEELVQQADHDYQGNIAELMIATEIELSGRDRSEILALMTRNLEVMKQSVQDGLSPEKSPTGLTGGWLIQQFLELPAMPWQSTNLMPRWAWCVRHQRLVQQVVCQLYSQLLSKN